MQDKDTNYAIQVDNINYDYDHLSILQNVSFKINQGNLAVISGHNGAGKSTLLNLINTSLKPKSGKIIINGKCNQKHATEIKKHIGVIFQSISLDKKLSLVENFKFYAWINKINNWEDKIANYLNWSSSNILQDYLEVPVEKLSGGMQRQGELIKCLITNPKILLMDEPTSGLDPHSRLSFLDTLNYIKKTNHVTILMTSHIVSDMLDSDIVLFMKEGKIKKIGKYQEIGQDFEQDKKLQILSTQSDVIYNIITEMGYKPMVYHNEIVVNIDNKSMLQLIKSITLKHIDKIITMNILPQSKTQAMDLLISIENGSSNNE